MKSPTLIVALGVACLFVGQTALTTGASAAAHPGPGRIDTPGKVSTLPILYDFKGVKLGLSLDEWLKAPTADAITSNVCSDNEKPEDFASNLHLSYKEQKSSVIACTKMMQITPTLKYLRGDTVGAYTINSTYYFFYNRLLYKIVVQAEPSSMNDLREGLVQRWGLPKSLDRKPVQNQFGAVYSQTSMKWANAIAEIDLTTAQEGVSEITVTYLSLEPNSKVEGAKAEPARM